MFRYFRVLFGLKNDLGAFQGAVGVIFASAKCKLAKEQIGNIIIFSKSPQHHLAHAEEVLRV